MEVTIRGRMKAKDAAELLGFSTDWLYTLAGRGDLRPVTNSGGRGRGKRIYFDPKEIEAYSRGGAPAARAYREQQEPTGRPKRGRRVKV